jgi:carbamoyl-phosphate synthase large subunit
LLQGILTSENQFFILEVNPRFGGASTCGIASGCNSLLWSLKSAEDIKYSPNPSEIVFKSVTQVRVPFDIYI